MLLTVTVGGGRAAAENRKLQVKLHEFHIKVLPELLSGSSLVKHLEDMQLRTKC